MKDTLYILRKLFIIGVYSMALANLLLSVANKDVYDLAMAIFLYMIANENKRDLDKIEAESEDGDD